MFSNILQSFISWLFPRVCFGCGAEGEWLCSNCLARLPVGPSAECPVCGIITAHGETCLACQSTCPLNGLTTFFKYQTTPALGHLIRALKYRRAYDIASVFPALWERVLVNSALRRLAPLQSATIIPVSLHRRRFLERGFNQAELLGSSLADALGRPFDKTSLVRVKATKQQTKLNRAERAANVAGAFAWSGTEAPPTNIILVDDVYTTGATMRAAAAALKKAGAGLVWGVALARD